jgi:hypothetical protein
MPNRVTPTYSLPPLPLSDLERKVKPFVDSVAAKCNRPPPHCGVKAFSLTAGVVGATNSVTFYQIGENFGKIFAGWVGGDPEAMGYIFGGASALFEGVLGGQTCVEAGEGFFEKRPNQFLVTHPRWHGRCADGGFALVAAAGALPFVMITYLVLADSDPLTRIVITGLRGLAYLLMNDVSLKGLVRLDLFKPMENDCVARQSLLRQTDQVVKSIPSLSAEEISALLASIMKVEARAGADENTNPHKKVQHVFNVLFALDQRMACIENGAQPAARAGKNLFLKRASLMLGKTIGMFSTWFIIFFAYDALKIILQLCGFENSEHREAIAFTLFVGILVTIPTMALWMNSLQKIILSFWDRFTGVNQGGPRYFQKLENGVNGASYVLFTANLFSLLNLVHQIGVADSHKKFAGELLFWWLLPITAASTCTLYLQATKSCARSGFHALETLCADAKFLQRRQLSDFLCSLRELIATMPKESVELVALWLSDSMRPLEVGASGVPVRTDEVRRAKTNQIVLVGGEVSGKFFTHCADSPSEQQEAKRPKAPRLGQCVIS